jgi:protein phosphatase
VRFACAGYSEIGLRSNQEDRFGCVQIQDGILAAVADGMGGHAAGEIAAQVAIDAVLKGKEPSLLSRFLNAQKQVLAAGHVPGQSGLGATCTALATLGSSVTWAHLGDARLSRVRKGLLTRLTADHSVAGSMLHHGYLTEEEFERGEGHQGLLQYVGMDVDRREKLPVEIGIEEARPGDLYLLTTDGVHGVLRRLQIQALLLAAASTDPRKVSRVLVQGALAARGSDNATCVCTVALSS